MSRHSGSSKHRRDQPQDMDGTSESLVEQSKSIVNLLNEVLSSRPNEWETYLVSARSAITALNHVRFFRDPRRFVEQVWLLNGLQDFAFHEPYAGNIQDIAEWCQTTWLGVLRNFPDNVEALTGLGRNWFQRSQPTLAKIYREEGADSSSGGSSSSPPTDPRRQGPLYVEAQGYLQPSAEFYTRAVRSADAIGVTSGDLLASAADAHISLGHVTGSPNDVRHFDQGIQYLRRADAMPGYYLSPDLQNHLDNYGRYVS